ncbi:DUF5017 domain-containing protein [Pedobacter sp. P351]|uniref:DUF5017 domain-containing protein n=1 Tax=Pedobacter superstes TaxID=3133441 RepID=UPI0030B3144F
MKNYKFLLPIYFMASIYGCKEAALEAPDFDVTVEKTTFAVAEDIVFTLKGDPDMITFYSGQPGKEYDKLERITDPQATNQLGFAVKYNDNFTNAAINQPRNLSVFVSNEFNGKWNDSASVVNGNWIDISNRVTWPSVTSTSVVTSLFDVSDFRSPRDTFFVAFRYKSSPSSATSKARAWQMSNFKFNNIGSNGLVYFNGITTNNVTSANDNRLAGFNAYSFKGSSVKDSLKWNLDATSTFPTGVDGLSDEDWLISRPFKMSSIILDRGVYIKKRLDVVNSYRYKYTSPGTYNVTFVAVNSTVEGGSKSTVKRLTLTIE